MRLLVLYNVAQFGRADWAQAAPEKLVSPPRPLVDHEVLGEAHGLRVTSVSVPHALLLDCFSQRLVSASDAALFVAFSVGFRVIGAFRVRRTFLFSTSSRVDNWHWSRCQRRRHLWFG